MSSEKMYDIHDEAGEYTLSAIDNCFEDFDAGEIVRQLKSNDGFRRFDDGLTQALITSGYSGDPESVPDKTKYLMGSITESGASITLPTIRNWLKGEKRPKCNAAGREIVFKLCFALRMSLDQTIRFFRKVYFDQPFNFRKPDECVYYYCFKNHLPYSESIRLKQILEQRRKELDCSADYSGYTIDVKNRLDEIKNEAELIEYLALNIPDKSVYFQTARVFISRMRETAIEYAKLENASFSNQYSGRSGNGTDFLLEVIYSLSYKSKLFPDKDITELVRKNFPTKTEFSMALSENDNVTADLMRKCLILLLFYNTFVKLTLDNTDDPDIFERFYTESSLVLDECGFAPLYPLNPYDSIFLKIIAGTENCNNCLDSLRDLISQINDPD